MGCVSSKTSIDNEERVQRCKERRRLMKQLVVVLRGEFAVSQMAYLHALKNTGVTLRQFAESESSVLDLDEISSSFDDELLPLPSSPLPPLPPPPPPPPPFSPNRRDSCEEEEEIVDGGGSGSDCTSPPPPVSGSSWNFWDPFDPLSSSSAPGSPKKKEVVEEEEWAETKTDFEEEEEEGLEEEEVVVVVEEDKVGGDIVLISLPEKPLVVDFHDENSSVASTDMAMVVRTRRRRKNTLLGILKEIDDYFLKAYDSGREVAILLDSNRGDSLHQNLEESMRKSFKSAKVFSALSWSWSSKSLQSSKDAVECHDSSEPCKPGAHCATLDKLNTEEERLYKEVKEEEMAKLEYDRKIFLLQKQDVGEQDSIKTEEARFSIESLESSIISLQESISKTCLSILKLRDEELHPQLLELSSRLTRMWRTMYECHQVQNHIAQQVGHLSNNPSTEPTSDYHRQSAVQLETEVNVWYNCFCNLLKSQREYVRVLSRWVLLAEGLVDDQQHIGFTSNIHILCEEWQLALDRLPEKVAAEAIKSFVSIIHSIVLQQTEERILHKKSDRLERRLQKELNTLNDMEKKFDGNLSAEGVSSLSPNHPLVVKRARIEAFRKKVDDEKAKYLHSVQVSRAMTLDNLQTSLPNVFQALTGFSSFCAQTFEAVHGLTQSTVCLEEELQPST